MPAASLSATDRQAEPVTPVPGAAAPGAVIFGCAGLTVSAEESALFRQCNPLGFILFRRNCESPDQVRALVASLRESVGRSAPVLIDQEGGRVARLRPPHWPELPATGRIGALTDPAEAERAAWLHGRLLASLLTPLGIDVDCAPVADVPTAGAHDVIGDRAFGRNPAWVARLAAAQAAGLLAGGVLPVVKHIPGHGRAQADSHLELPTVDASLEALEAQDFPPFRALAGLPLAMAAHVVFTAIDPVLPASTSRTVIDQIVRGWIGFGGLLISDDIGMQALAGSPAERALAVLSGGCDVALHCSGKLEEMQEVAQAVPVMTGQAHQRWQRAEALRSSGDGLDPVILRAELDALLNSVS
jgi:beta-N-acetylhexosaminidase